MPLATCKTEVHAPADRVWALLLDKIEHPERYVPGVTRAEIVARPGPDTVERVMHLGDRRVHELITADVRTRSVLFKLVDDPVHTGFVLNTVFAEGERVWLDFTLHWTPREGPDDGPSMAATVERAVLHTKALAEAEGPSPR